MNDIRLASMFYDQRGPLVFSASLHLVGLVIFAIWAFVEPEKKPEELVFELVSPPAAGQAAETPLEPLDYRSEQVDLPTLDDLPPLKPLEPVEPEPEPQPEPEPEPQPEPVVEKKPEPVVEKESEPVVEKKPEPEVKMTRAEFMKQFQVKDEVKNVRSSEPPPPRQRVDFSSQIERMKSDLNKFSIEGLPRAEIESMSVSDQQQLASYMSGFIRAVASNVEKHPFGAQPLSALVRCDISSNGVVTNAAIVRSSGDGSFDRKVVNAMKRMRNYRSPPDGQQKRGIQFELFQQ